MSAAERLNLCGQRFSVWRGYANAHRRKGIASKILEHILEVAKQREYTQLFLETGSFPAFEPARTLYERYGFGYRGPFGDYVLDPNSVFMHRRI